MQTEWDYSNLAQAYLKRPDYAASAIDEMLALAGCRPPAVVCDVGAGVAHLTLQLAGRGLTVQAVEPNDAMRALGRERTAHLPRVQWSEGSGEQTGQESGRFDMVTFGSSFNVTDRPAALRESCRILKKRGWFAALWNHRDLDDPFQQKIEQIIRDTIPDYDYGTRRQDQTEVIRESGLFGEVIRMEGTIVHAQTPADLVEAWRSHATLQRQAGARLPAIIQAIERLVTETGQQAIPIPYTTRIWMAQAKL
ncbi:MAG: methyltransferase domain-containing protein [Magnetococcales bacterium]|nr:methyltransferase domain-containing protein [Magnetococcales bacterium]